MAFLPHTEKCGYGSLSGIGKTAPGTPLPFRREVCVGSTIYDLFSQHLPHDFPPPNVRPFSFSGRRCSTGSHALAFGVGHSCVNKLSWEKPRPGSRGGRHIIGKFLEERERDERKQEQPGTRGNACWGGCTALRSWQRAPSRHLWPASRSPNGANRTGLGKEDSSEATWCRMHM